MAVGLWTTPIDKHTNGGKVTIGIGLTSVRDDDGLLTIYF